MGGLGSILIGKTGFGSILIGKTGFGSILIGNVFSAVDAAVLTDFGILISLTFIKPSLSNPDKRQTYYYTTY